MALVSILIPAYNPRFFGEALGSALGQSYENFEVIVCDDSPGAEIEMMCQAMEDDRLRYVRNPVRLGFGKNFTECFNRSTGTYIKFLNDDDVLLSDCVTRLVHEFESRTERVTLVTSRRKLIDGLGAPCPDTESSRPIAESTTCFNGLELGDRVFLTGRNFIGEPTTAMFRRSDLEPEPGGIFVLNGRDYVCWADMSLWLRLMSKGDAVYVAEPLSCLRKHTGQLQRSRDVGPLCATERLFLIQDGLTLGYLKDRDRHVQALETACRFIDAFLEVATIRFATRVEIEDVRRSVTAELKRVGRLP